ncbi:MAG: hypothetical protein HYY16_11640, partial [Planctomycetes bacterium]|nr:hypothetical protein [Planctomycetota bacterium]
MKHFWRCVEGAILAGLTLGCGCSDGGSSGSPSSSPDDIVAGIVACGGDARGAGMTAGVGGRGGAVHLLAERSVTLGFRDPTPARPAAPVPPSGGTALTREQLGADVNAAGPLVISGEVSAPGPSEILTIHATQGDIVVAGTLTAHDAGAVTQDLQLLAPNGTIFVLGAIRTASTDGSATGDRAGSITLEARRVVVAGLLDAGGEANANGPGGAAGAVTITAQGDSVFLPAGLIAAGGGDGTTAGGEGAVVAIDSAGPVHLHTAVVAAGGQANGESNVRGARAGQVRLAATESIDVTAPIRARGGRAAASRSGAVGGPGGIVSFSGSADLRFFGAIDVRGGSAGAGSAEGEVRGGDGGEVDIGFDTRLRSIALFDATLSSCGGSAAKIGGTGGTFVADSSSGFVTLGVLLDARGGDGAGQGPANGGAGGVIQLTSNATAPQPPLRALPVGIADASGGAGIGGGRGGAGGTIQVEMRSSGIFSPQGQLRANGGLPDGDGGLVIVGHSGREGRMDSSAEMSATGSVDGGNGGAIRVVSNAADIALAGRLTVRGGDSLTHPGSGGTIDVACDTRSGSIVSTAALDAGGGSSSAPMNESVPGGNGGRVRFEAFSASGSITLASGAAIVCDGGASTGKATAGQGGRIRMDIPENFISVAGTLFARGGAARGAGGHGGRGGSVKLVGDSDGIDPN